MNENRVRRWAGRLGHRLIKSRARRLHINDRGLYQLINDNGLVVVGSQFEADLDEVEAYLKAEEDRLRG